MRLVRLSVCAAVAAACGQGSSTERPHFQLALTSQDSSTGSAPATTMTGGDSRVIELLVIGTVSGPVTFSARKLPPFATLKGPLVTLSPARMDAGTFPLEIDATDGRETATAAIDVVVERYNTAPRGAFNWIEDMPDREIVRAPFDCPSSQFCTVFGIPKIYMFVCDDENDAITVSVEIVPRGQPFTKVPTYSVTAPAGSAKAVTGSSPLAGSYCQNILLPMPGLEVEHSYDFAIKLSDQSANGKVDTEYWARGATSDDGWVRAPASGFDVGPCSTRTCACMPDAASGCVIDAHCCSGRCINHVGPEQWGTCAPVSAAP